MSDITGPPVPKPLSSGVIGTDRAAKVSRDPNQTPRQTTDDSGENKSKSEQREALHSREPAVSIAATAAHLRIGEELQERVREVDTEGRPIIVTETATFALRPDAGLRAGDDVILQVTETGKSVSADLLRHNSRVIEPPIRLSLIVIAVHNIEAPGTGQGTGAGSKPQEVAYRPSQSPNTAPSVSRVENLPADTEALAKVLTRSNNSLNVKPGTDASEVKQDPLIKSNSSDMATLLAAQQEPRPSSSQPDQPTRPVNPNDPQRPSVLGPSSSSTHIIQSSRLTDPTVGIAATTSQAPNASVTGLGPAISAITLDGKPFQIQLLDTSVSSVAPSEVAEVNSVRSLAIDVARALPVAAQSLGQGALARVETSRGSYILPEEKANQLVGETIRVTALVTQPATQPAAPENNLEQSYKARLTAPGAQTGRQVQVQFSASAQSVSSAVNTNQNNIVTAVDAVHTVRAFLGGDGPTNDLRLDTNVGSLTLTLSSSARPSVGDPIIILPGTASGTASQIVAPTGAEAVTTGTLGSTSWPSLEQTYALAQSGLPGVAQALENRSAQGGPKLLNSMMFLMAAIKGGAPSAWLGKASEHAIGGKNNSLLQSLKDDLARMFNAGSETTSSEWRSLLLPFDTRSPDMPMLAALFSQPQQIDPDQEQHARNSKSDEEQDQRFVVEVQFSVLGAIQLDGIIRSNRFDLTLWSKAALPAQLAEDTTEIFANALAANGFTGSMQYRQSDVFPTDVAAILGQQLAA